MIIVTPEAQDSRLDRFLRRQLPGLTQGIIEKSLRNGLIKLDNKRSTASTRLSAGQEITIAQAILDNINQVAKKPTKALSAKEAATIEESVIYLDDNLIVINKPAGLAVQGGSKIMISVDDMLDALKFEKSERPKLVHRLDKDTSGVLLLARSGKVAAGLSELFKNQDFIEKTYWALVRGRPPKRHGSITSIISKETTSENFEKMANSETGKEAISLYRVRDNASSHATWLEMQPITGRTHQLRIHAAELGCPIIGDLKYGSREDYVKGLSRKLHLHARSIFIKNFMGQSYKFVAPMPKHMEDSWNFLGFHA